MLVYIIVTGYNDPLLDSGLRVASFHSLDDSDYIRFSLPFESHKQLEGRASIRLVHWFELQLNSIEGGEDFA